MSGALADLLGEALNRAARPIRSTDGDCVCGSLLQIEGRRVAESLLERGLEQDEPVLIAMGNRPVDLASLLGVWLAGGVAVPVHVAAAASTLARVQEASLARYRVDGATVSEVTGQPPPRRPLLAGAALVIFTSGTTGRPKGVVLGHDRFKAKLDALRAVLALDASDIVVVPLQLTFIFGLWASLLALGEGAGLVLVPKFSPQILDRAPGDAATVLAAVPTMLRIALTDAAALKAPALRKILVGGEPLGSVLSTAIRRAVPQVSVTDLYGSTETGSCDFRLPGSDQMAALGSIGRPMDGIAYRLIGDDGSSCEQGEAGELQIATPFRMLGYLDDPALTEASFRDGFFRTGDIARLRPDGRVELVGRLTEMILRAGNKIAPLEIEAVMAEHPDVAGCLCAGAPDERLGQAIHAVAVLKPGSPLTPLELRAWISCRVETFKVPDVIRFVDALPLGSTGKASRALVTETMPPARPTLDWHG